MAEYRTGYWDADFSWAPGWIWAVLHVALWGELHTGTLFSLLVNKKREKKSAAALTIFHLEGDDK